jgi:hypothetical protein
MIPAVQAKVDIISLVNNAPYVFAERAQSENPAVGISSGFNAVSSMPAAETPGWDFRNCQLHNCASAASSGDASGVRPEEVVEHSTVASELHAAKSDDNSASVLDTGLMLFFAFGLLAHPLIRKHRALLHSSVLAPYF